jgi:hypothetical protein
MTCQEDIPFQLDQLEVGAGAPGLAFLFFEIKSPSSPKSGGSHPLRPPL